MAVKPRIITKKSRRTDKKQVDFNFSPDNIRTSGAYVTKYRKAAYEKFTLNPLPHTKMEAWRRTDLKNLHPEQYNIHNGQNVIEIPRDIAGWMEPSHNAGSAMISPGSALIQANPQWSKKGVIFTDLATAENRHAELLEKILGKVVSPQEGKFSALTGAFAQTGLFLYIPKNVIIEEPFESMFYTAGNNSAFISQIVILLEEGAAATLTHRFTSPKDGDRKLHSGTIEILVGENANLTFIELQELDNNAVNFTHERAKVDQNGTLDWVIGTFGSELSKNFIDLDLMGEGASGNVSGISFTNGDQHFDIDTQQNHRVPYTTSDLLFKGALTENSRSIWQGMIYVEKGAEKTDGYQTNRNLVLSSSARADSIPGLEIKADDVRCSHGATIGGIDDEQVFYLTSRGLSRADAEKLVIDGFFEPVVNKLPNENIKDHFRAAINAKIA